MQRDGSGWEGLGDGGGWGEKGERTEKHKAAVTKQPRGEKDSPGVIL